MTDSTKIWHFKLFIDDERYPVTDDFLIARNMDEVKILVAKFGPPVFVSFDHDLGENEPTGYDIAKWLCEEMEKHKELSMFKYYVHSQNPIGKANIESYLECFRREIMNDQTK